MLSPKVASEKYDSHSWVLSAGGVIFWEDETESDLWMRSILFIEKVLKCSKSCWIQVEKKGIQKSSVQRYCFSCLPSIFITIENPMSKKLFELITCRNWRLDSIFPSDYLYNRTYADQTFINSIFIIQIFINIIFLLYVLCKLFCTFFENSFFLLCFCSSKIPWSRVDKTSSSQMHSSVHDDTNTNRYFSLPSQYLISKYMSPVSTLAWP